MFLEEIGQMLDTKLEKMKSDMNEMEMIKQKHGFSGALVSWGFLCLNHYRFDSIRK